MTTLDYLPWQQPTGRADAPCVRDETCELSYRELGEWVDAAAEQFAELGVGAGSVVAIMLPNRVELLVAMLAAWRVGAAATPINPVFTAHEADYQIQDAQTALVVNSGPRAPDGGRPSLAVDALRRHRAASTPLPEPTTAPTDLALLIYTSGSTGRPKGVMLNHANLAAMTSMMVGHLGVTAADHCLLVLPLFHVNAICVSVLTPLAVGGQVSVLARFKPADFLATIEKLRPTYFSAVPTIYAHLLTQPDDAPVDTSSVRVAICGAAPAPAGLLERVEQHFGFPVIEGYGLTEGTCASSANPIHDARKPGTVGVALPGQRIAIMAPDGGLQPAGQRGEVVIQGANVMQGYLNRPEETADALGDGWLHTGDVGILDEGGYLSIVDRIKDMIIRGGENIYPKEIETVLQSHRAVVEAAVVGAPHQALGEVPVAYVAAADGSVDAEKLIALCREQLTKIKVPVEIHLMDALPKNAIGKIDKPALRSAAASAASAAHTPQGA